MYETYELPSPVALAALDDLGLVEAVDTATLVASLAIDVRVAAIQEMYTRQLRAPAATRPTPTRPQAALQRTSRRRKRRQRKRRNRRR